jgi:diadenosine tetraphosphatase ApaH/serine/threonine PP2A family protein phosphatase
MSKLFAVLGDIHANLDALNVVLDDCRSQGVTDFLCTGDVVGYNACPHECMDIIRAIGCPVVVGNHDFYVSSRQNLDDFNPAAAAVVQWTRKQLSVDEIYWLRNLPFTHTQMGVTLVHSTMDNPENFGYVVDNLQAEANFLNQKTPVCFHGHTHVPAVFEKVGSRVDRYAAPEPGMRVSLSFGHKYFINVGSVGQPRDGIPKASYAIYEPRSRIIEFRRVDFDIKAAADKVRRAGLPQRLADRLEIGR